MRVIGLTGSIATGKSTVFQMLQNSLPNAVFFDCDEVVQSLLVSDHETIFLISERFPKSIGPTPGEINKRVLQKIVFSDPLARADLEKILHPKVRKECIDSQERAVNHGAEAFIADVPLLYESSFQFGQSQVIVVGCSEPVQILRMKARNAYSDDLIEAILQAQLPVPAKMSQANTVFWNEGPLEILRSQVTKYARQIYLT